MVVAEIIDGIGICMPRLLKTDDVGVNLVDKLDDSLLSVHVADTVDIEGEKTENDASRDLSPRGGTSYVKFGL